jgi:hypothetical protein
MPIFTVPNDVLIFPVALRHGRLDVGEPFHTLEMTRTETEDRIYLRRVIDVSVPDGAFVFQSDRLHGGSHHRLVGGELVKTTYRDALDALDPEGAARRRYEARIKFLPRKPRRFTLAVDHADDEWIVGDTYPDERWEGAYVVCTQRAGRQVWYRAATFAEVYALGIRP